MNGNFVVDWTGLVDRDAEDGGGSPRRLMSPDAFALMIAPATPDLGTDFNSHWSDKLAAMGVPYHEAWTQTVGSYTRCVPAAAVRCRVLRG